MDSIPQLTWVDTVAYKGFRAYIGVKANGKRKVWYFGREAVTARQRLLERVLQWERIVAAGGVCWPPESRGLPCDNGESHEPNKGPTAAPPVPHQTLHVTLFQCLDEYQKEKEATCNDRHKRDIVHRIKRLKAVIGTDLPFTRESVAIAVGKVKATGWSGTTQWNYANLLKSVIIWADEVKELTIRGYRKLIKRGQFDIEDDPQPMPLDAFISFWKASDSRCRLYLALGLNCGFTQTEIATLTPAHYDGEFIRRKRNKTRVAGEWYLWKVTKTLIEEHKEESGGLLFRTEQGYPLVHDRSDSIAQMLERIGMVGKGKCFKAVRKLAGELVEEYTDHDTARAFLAHQRKTVAERHYLRRANAFPKITVALKAIEAKLMLS